MRSLSITEEYWVPKASTGNLQVRQRQSALRWSSSLRFAFARTTSDDWAPGISLLLKALLSHRINQVTSLVNVWPSTLFQGHKAFTLFYPYCPCCPRTRTRCLFSDMIFQDTVQSPALSSSDGSATLLQSALLVSANGTRRFSSQQNIPQLKLSLVPSFHLI